MSTPSPQSPAPPLDWHTSDTATVLAAQHSDAAAGLATAEAEKRLLAHGANALTARATRSPFELLLDQFKDFMIIILLAVVLGQVLHVEGTILEKIGSNIISMFIVFGLLYWVGMARLIRGQILSLREQEYVLSAQATGAKAQWIIRKHLLPNCISVVIISTALQIPNAIFTESFLSFLGLGVNAPMPSLGSLASDALNGIYSYTYRLIIPAVVICLIVLSLNLFGDGLRDAFDPKLNA